MCYTISVRGPLAFKCERVVVWLVTRPSGMQMRGWWRLGWVVVSPPTRICVREVVVVVVEMEVEGPGPRHLRLAFAQGR